MLRREISEHRQTYRIPKRGTPSVSGSPIVRIRRAPGLTIEIYDALSERIMDGQLQPGDPIIIEQVAVQLGVSPTPVRESLARLAEQGLITKGQNGRLALVRISPEHVRDVYRVRAALEGLAAELAAPRITSDDIETLRVALDDILAMVDQGEYQQYIAAAEDIFGVILQAANSPALTRELAVLRLHTGFVRSMTKRFIGNYVQVIHDELRVVVDALVAADPAAARQAMEVYLRNSGDRVAHLIQILDDLPWSPADVSTAREQVCSVPVQMRVRPVPVAPQMLALPATSGHLHQPCANPRQHESVLHDQDPEHQGRSGPLPGLRQDRLIRCQPARSTWFYGRHDRPRELVALSDQARQRRQQCRSTKGRS